MHQNFAKWWKRSLEKGATRRQFHGYCKKITVENKYITINTEICIFTEIWQHRNSDARFDWLQSEKMSDADW